MWLRSAGRVRKLPVPIGRKVGAVYGMCAGARQTIEVAVSRAERRAEREQRCIAEFGVSKAQVALDLLEVLEFAWHDCYQEVTPPPEVIDDIFVCSAGALDAMIQAAKMALADWRDLRLWADDRRAEQR